MQYNTKEQADRDTLAAIAALTNDQIELIQLALFIPCPRASFIRAAIENEHEHRFPELQDNY